MPMTISITTLVNNPTFNKIGHHTTDKLTTPTPRPPTKSYIEALKSKLHTVHDNLCLTLF